MTKHKGLKELILSKPFKFWCCPNKEHKRVTWDGDIATCDECDETSQKDVDDE